MNPQLKDAGVRLSLGGTLYDPADPMGKMFVNILATFAEFEVDLLKLRTREGMAVARSRGRLKGKQPKLPARQQAELVRMHATGEYTIADLMEVFSFGRATVYRVLERASAQPPSPAAALRPRSTERKVPHTLIAAVSIGVRAGQRGGTDVWVSSHLVSHA